MRVCLVAVFLLLVGGPARAADNKIPADFLTALEKGEEFELYSLRPKFQKDKPKDNFHGWLVLGKTTVKDADTRTKLVTALKKGVADLDGLNIPIPDAFGPTHGIRVVHDKKTFDFVIAFDCCQAQIFTGDKEAGEFLTTDSPQTAFNGVLKDAKVPVAGKDK